MPVTTPTFEKGSSRSSIAFFVLAGIWAGLFLSGRTSAAPPPILRENGSMVTLQAEGLPLKQILEELQTGHGLIFSGIFEYSDQEVTLSCTGSVMDVVKSLLKTLGVRNYAFTFSGERLIHVSVLPVSFSAVTTPPPLVKESHAKKTTPLDTSAVLVKTVLPGTQGERISLAPNDVILSYNGARVPNAQRLIALVKQYEQEDRINLVIARDGIPMEFILEGGFIGVQIITVPVDSQTLEGLYRASGL